MVNYVFLGIVEGNKIIGTKKASVTPVIGYNTFDTRHYKNDDGVPVTERHLGNKIIEIDYA